MQPGVWCLKPFTAFPLAYVQEVMRVRSAGHEDGAAAVAHFCERLAFAQSEIEIGEKHGKSYRVVLVYYTTKPGVPETLAHAVLYPNALFTGHTVLGALTAGGPVLGHVGVCCGRVARSLGKKRRADDSSVPYHWETVTAEDMLASVVPIRGWDDAGEHQRLLGEKLEGTPLGRVLREAVAVRLLAHGHAPREGARIAVPEIVHSGSGKERA